jgi:thymidylate kinase
MRHLKPRLVMRRAGMGIVVDPHGKPRRSAVVSLAKIFVWLMEEWYARLFQDRNEALLICDRYYHDLLIDPVRYRYGGPTWTAKAVGRLMPQPDQWILLDASPEVLQSRKQEVPWEETARQRNAYVAFVQAQKNSAIVDASQSLDKVVTDVEQVILRSIARGRGNCE